MGTNSGLAEIVRELAQTTVELDPVLRMKADQQVVKVMASTATKLNFLLSWALIVSVSANGILGWMAATPDRQYFAADHGTIVPLVPLKEPYREAADVIQFAKDQLNKSFSLDFLNWRMQLEGSRSGYTAEGFKSLIASLQKAEVLDTVKNKRMNLSSTVGTGVLVQEGEQDGKFVWVVEVPVELRMSGQTSQLPPQKFLATVRVERIPTRSSVGGIGISQIVTKPL